APAPAAAGGGKRRTAVAGRARVLPRRPALADETGARSLMLRVACLPGDGIGPEVTAVAIEVLRALPLEVEVEEHAFGGGAILAEGAALPHATLGAGKAAG